jgi:cobalamin synthase
MDQTLGSAPLRLGRWWLPAVGLVLGLLLAAIFPARGGLVGPGILAVGFVLAAFTGLAKTSSA